jgi:SAM-dependent methyltransferase
MDWYKRLYEGREAFQDEEEERAYRDKQRALTLSEVDQLCELVRLAPGARVLDAFCGNGRHSIGLAERGIVAFGLDAAFSRIAFAHRWARAQVLRASFLVGDARILPLRASLDGILILGGSFTHCLGWEENLLLLTGFRDLLRPGGVLLIDNPNPHRFQKVRDPQETFRAEDVPPYFDFPLGALNTSEVVRYFFEGPMERLLAESGFEVQGIMGDRMGGAYTQNSPRLIAVGRIPS